MLSIHLSDAAEIPVRRYSNRGAKYCPSLSIKVAPTLSNLLLKEPFNRCTKYVSLFGPSKVDRVVVYLCPPTFNSMISSADRDNRWNSIFFDAVVVGWCDFSYENESNPTHHIKRGYYSGFYLQLNTHWMLASYGQFVDSLQNICKLLCAQGMLYADCVEITAH